MTRKAAAAPVFKYPGAKWRLAKAIVSLLPPHEHYLEPFAGSAAVFFSKPPARIETLVDAEDEVVNVFRVLREEAMRERLARLVSLTPWSEAELIAAHEVPPAPLEDPVERARRFLVRCWMSIGARQEGAPQFRYAAAGGDSHDVPTRGWGDVPRRIEAAAKRLKNAQVLRGDALSEIAKHADSRVLLYADPPYPRSVCSRRYYRKTMSDADHERLLGLLVAHPGPALVSGYAYPLYDDALSGWHRLGARAFGQRGVAREEVVWLNEVAWRGSRVGTAAALF